LAESSLELERIYSPNFKLDNSNDWLYSNWIFKTFAWSPCCKLNFVWISHRHMYTCFSNVLFKTFIIINSLKYSRKKYSFESVKMGLFDVFWHKYSWICSQYDCFFIQWIKRYICFILVFYLKYLKKHAYWLNTYQYWQSQKWKYYNQWCLTFSIGSFYWLHI
jgi:hypothetical protein